MLAVGAIGSAVKRSGGSSAGRVQRQRAVAEARVRASSGMEEPPHRLRSRRRPVGIVTPRLGAHDEEGNGRVQHAGLLALEELIEPAQLHIVDDARSAAFIW